VVAVRAGARGPALGGDGPVVDHLVKMHRMPTLALASERLARGVLDTGQLARLASRLAAFHRDAPAVGPQSPYGTPAAVGREALHVLDEIAALEPAGDRGAVGALRSWVAEQLARLEPAMAARHAQGRVRDGHGDLHLDNVIVLGDEVTAFDCIEFDPALRCVDVMNDAGFLVMDLLAHGRRDLAFGFLNAYLEAGGDYTGLSVLRFYVVYRALVRSLVASLRASQGTAVTAQGALDYLRLARRLAQLSDGAAPVPGPAEGARLLITHGLPGAGKSHVSQQLLERAGAIRIRSDVERKRLSGLDPLADSRAAGVGDLYTPERNVATYERLAGLAEIALRAGYPTILDAAFLRRSEREPLRRLAHGLGVPFHILDCQAPLDLLRERVRQRSLRGGDPSEADVAVLERLAAAGGPLDPDERASTIEVRTDRPLPIASILGQWLGTARSS
jgi:hypothetical protein